MPCDLCNWEQIAHLQQHLFTHCTPSSYSQLTGALPDPHAVLNTLLCRVEAGRIPLRRGLGGFAELLGAQSKCPSSQQDAALQSTWFTWQRKGKQRAGGSHTCVGGKDHAGLAEGCSHGSLFSLLQLLPQGLNLTQKMASLSLVLGLFGFSLENRKIGVESTAATQFWPCL